jgi:hypothetical protein
LRKKIRPGAQRRCGDFFAANPQGPVLPGCTGGQKFACEKANGVKPEKLKGPVKTQTKEKQEVRAMVASPG